MTIAARLSAISLEDSHSREKKNLAALWQDRDAVLIFLRHFG